MDLSVTNPRKIKWSFVSFEGGSTLKMENIFNIHLLP